MYGAQRTAVDVASFALPERGRELVAELGLPAWRDGSDARFVLREVHGVLGLHALAERWKPLVVDFDAAGYARRVRGAAQPLLKALGVPPSSAPTVLDATAGLGRDAFLLQHAGCLVVAVERSPVLHALLRDGIRRAGLPERLSLIHGDARDVLVELGSRASDVVYLDPMFPETDASALPKRELQYLRALLGDDGNAAELCRLALRLAGRRVLVKRPHGAPPLVEGVTHAFRSKLVRIDMYDVGSR